MSFVSLHKSRIYQVLCPFKDVYATKPRTLRLNARLSSAKFKHCEYADVPDHRLHHLFHLRNLCPAMLREFIWHFITMYGGITFTLAPEMRTARETNKTFKKHSAITVSSFFPRFIHVH